MSIEQMIKALRERLPYPLSWYKKLSNRQIIAIYQQRVLDKRSVKAYN